MGQVWQATDTQLNRDVALKILPDAFAADPDRLARFQREAQVLASLNHPNIAAIYGIEEAEGTRALVLELVEGPTLADRISKGPIPVDEALPIAKQIAEALEAAHEAGVIHRDLKPANIKVREDGTVKVLDFGLAKAFQPDASAPGLSASTAAATQRGMLIGTAAYMAPEQARGKPVDKRADIWAFGVVLLEMLTGRRVFRGETGSEMLAEVMKTEPSWDRLPAEVPPGLDSLLRRCLQKDPRQRVRDIGDVRLAMEGALETTGDAPTEPNVTPLRVWQRPSVILVAGMTAILASSLTVWSLMRPGPQALSRFEIPLRAEESFNPVGGGHIVAVSPNGRHIVYNTTAGLSLRSLDQVAPVLVAGTEGNGFEPFFSPDSQWIGFYAGGQLKKVSVTGGAPVTLGDAQAPFGASWGDNDMILYGQGSEGIWRVPGSGGTPEPVITVENGEQAHGPQMLPDEWVLFTFRPAGASWDESHIVMQSLANGERVVLIEGGRDARYVETGHLVYASNDMVLAVAFDLDARQVLGGPVPLVEGVRGSLNTGAAQFSVATNGSLVYVPGDNQRGVYALVWVDREGRASPVVEQQAAYAAPRVSPVGSLIAVSIAEEDNTDIWVIDADRGTRTRLTTDASRDIGPLWTPDGTRIVFSLDRGGGPNALHWMAADGSGCVERLTESRRSQGATSWLPDGSALAFYDVGTPYDIFTLIPGEQPVRFRETESWERGPAFSPDGRWLAYSSNVTGRAEVYATPYPGPGGTTTISTSGGRSPRWSADGRELFYRNGDEMLVVAIETAPSLQVGSPQVLFARPFVPEAPSSGAHNYDVTADGQRFLMLEAVADGIGGEPSREQIILVQDWFQELTDRVPTN